MKTDRSTKRKRRTSQLTTATGNTFKSSVNMDVPLQSERMPDCEYLQSKIDKLRKQNAILLDWNRKAEKEKLQIKQVFEEQTIQIERLRRQEKQRKQNKENLPYETDRSYNIKDKEGKCSGCRHLKLQLADKDNLISTCKQDLSDIKRQMATYAMIRSSEAHEESELKDKIITKLQKELLDSRIDLMRLREQLTEVVDLKTSVRPAVKAKELEGRLSMIRKNMQKNNQDQQERPITDNHHHE